MWKVMWIEKGDSEYTEWQLPNWGIAVWWAHTLASLGGLADLPHITRRSS